MNKYLMPLSILWLTLTACQPVPTTASTQTPAPVDQPTPTSAPFNPSVKVVGELEMVYHWDENRCADNMLPDLPTRAIRDADGMVQLTIPSVTNYRLIGPDFDSLEPDCSPVMFSDEDRNPANYNHSEWLAATYTEDGNTIHAIIHNEYHGDQAGSVWQAKLDFSSEQGAKNWSYQSWNGSSYSDMTYNASNNEWVGSHPLCLVGNEWMHPDVGCDPVRIWTSPIRGTITINGFIRDQDASGGNGVVAQILKGEEELWSVTIENGDEANVSYNLEAEVQEGDKIHFRVNAQGDAGWDNTFFDPGINIGPAPCPSGRHDMCTLISLTSATSTNGGKTYTHPPAPDHRIASFPYQYDPEWMRSIWQPSAIVKNPNDDYYYVLIQYDEHNSDYSYNAQGMCVMRTQTLDDPTSWRAWDGIGFNMRFIDPYSEIDTNPEDHDCVLIAPENGSMSYSLSYNRYLEKFVAVGVSGGDQQGYYYALSDDLIHWTPKEIIMPAVMGFENGNQTPFDAYPTLIDHDSPSMSFDVTGQSAYLYYTVFTNDNPWSMDLVRVEIEFSK
jgi:hypothetical protein